MPQLAATPHRGLKVVLALVAMLVGALGLAQPASAVATHTVVVTATGSGTNVDDLVVLACESSQQFCYQSASPESEAYDFAYTDNTGSVTFQLPEQGWYFKIYDDQKRTGPNSGPLTLNSSSPASVSISISLAPPFTCTAVLTGVQGVGDPVKATATFSGPVYDVHYDWYRGASPNYDLVQDSSVLNSDTYTPTQADLGHPVSVELFGSNGTDTTVATFDVGLCDSADSAAIGAGTAAPAPAPPVVIAPGTPVPGAVAPAIAGQVKKGKTVSAGVTVPVGATASYQWFRTFKNKKHKTVTKPIGGAAGPTYKLKAGDKGKKVSVVVTYTRTGYAPTVLKSAPKKVK